MKKIILVFVLFAGLAASAVFADDNSEDWGVGAVGGVDFLSFGEWFDAGLFLKIPKVPVFWGINARIYGKYFGIGATGDYYFYDDFIFPNAGFGWFLGVGGAFNMNFNVIYSDLSIDPDTQIKYGYDDYISMDMFTGVRVPVGLKFQLQIKDSVLRAIDLFANLAPAIGLFIDFADTYDRYFYDKNLEPPQGKTEVTASETSFDFKIYIAFQFGVRFWFKKPNPPKA